MHLKVIVTNFFSWSSETEQTGSRHCCELGRGSSPCQEIRSIWVLLCKWHCASHTGITQVRMNLQFLFDFLTCSLYKRRRSWASELLVNIFLKDTLLLDVPYTLKLFCFMKLGLLRQQQTIGKCFVAMATV